MAASIQRGRAARGVPAAWGAVLALVVAWGAWPAAHDIPASVTVHAFARPEGDRLRVLLRVPLVAMRDVVWPMRDAAMLDLGRLEQALEDAARRWLATSMAFWEDDRALGAPALVSVRVSLPSDRSFASYEEARAHLSATPIETDALVPLASALLDAAFEYPIASDRARFSIDPQFARLGLRVVTILRFQPPDGAERAFQFTGDPGIVRIDPRWHQAALTFVSLGFEHILDGIDHLLFLACLVLPLRRFWHLVGVVTAFTVAHSITLASAAVGLTPEALWFPPLVETLIAASIVYMALENVVVAVRAGADRPIAGMAVRGRWLIAFAFGLVHGFGFSFALEETLQFAGAHLVTSLFAFNVGVELGQLLVLVVLVPTLGFAFRRLIEPRLGIIIASVLIAHTAWHWMTERGATLGEYDWPSADPATLATLLRGLMVIVAVGGGIWIYRQRRR